MLIGAHPPQGSVGNPHCPYSWVFACDWKDAASKRPCGRQRSYRCDGGPHILLEEAFMALLRDGWRLDPDGRGTLCSAHRDAPLLPARRRARAPKGDA